MTRDPDVPEIGGRAIPPDAVVILIVGPGVDPRGIPPDVLRRLPSDVVATEIRPEFRVPLLDEPLPEVPKRTVPAQRPVAFRPTKEAPRRPPPRTGHRGR